MTGIESSPLVASFVTFFVVIDPIGVTPIFAGLTEGAPWAHRRRMAAKSVLIATVILFGFAYGGEWLLGALHVSLDAFRAAGGVLLFILALEMIFEQRTKRRNEKAGPPSEAPPGVGHRREWEDISVFPMALPLIAGPGAIASVMLFMRESNDQWVHQLAVFTGMGLNLALCLVLFVAAGPVMRRLGDTLAAVITRILGVILAALAAQFILDGVRGALFV